MLRNSKTSISNPKEASTRTSARSATLATSIMALTSLEHSTRVSLCRFPDTRVTGPRTSVSAWRVKFLTRARSRVDLPTLGGPTMATTAGGGSVGALSTCGTCLRFSEMSSLRRTRRSALPTFCMAKARGFLWRASSALSSPRLTAFFLSSLALRPLSPRRARWDLLDCASPPSMMEDALSV